MKLVWLTDLHLNFVGRAEVYELCKTILTAETDAVLITGDIASAQHLCKYLDYLADEIRKPIYFVLGNHDYYGSSIEKVNSEVAKASDSHMYLYWLSRRDRPVHLTDDTCLIGHEGLSDGRMGDPVGSDVELNDYRLIKELVQPTKQERLRVQNHLGDLAEEHLRDQVTMAVEQYKLIIVALHVPPFAEAAWHLGQNTDDNYLPHFSCKATGDVLKATMLAHPEVSMTVYCGHTHSGGHVQILPNLEVITAGAEYYKPRIAGNIEI